MNEAVTSTESLRQQLNQLIDPPETNQQVVSQVSRQMADKIVNDRVELLKQVYCKIESLDESIAKADKPDTIFFSRTEKGEFVAVEFYSKPAKDQVETSRQKRQELAAAFEKCLKPEATGTDYDALRVTFRTT